MPWHDVAIKVEGDVVRDISKHFIQYWNFACVDLDKKGKEDILVPRVNTKS